MAITQVGSATTATAATAGTVAVNKPTGVAQDDVMITCIAHNEGTAITAPSGWTSIVSDTSSPNSFGLYIYRKTAGASEPSSYTWTGDTTTGVPIVVICSAWRGVDTSAPINGTSVQSAGNVTENDTASFTTQYTSTTDVRELYVRGCRSTTAIPSFTVSTGGWAELADAGDYSGGTVRYGLGLFNVTFDTGVGTKTEPATTCSTTETDNIVALVGLAVAPTNPSDTDSGTVTESESFSVTAADSDSGTVTESEFIGVPITDSDSGTVSEAENVQQITEIMATDSFNRADETPINISSSGHLWTSAGSGVLSVVDNQCKKTA